MFQINGITSNPDRTNIVARFIEHNNLTLARSDDEMSAKIGEHEGGFLDFTLEVILRYAPFANVRRFYKDEFLAKVDSGSEPEPASPSIEQTIVEFLDYMEFAWGKAEDQRGISAGRSIQKLSAWMWLLGRQDIDDVLNDGSLYNPYGAPALIRACEMLNIEVPESLRIFASTPCR